MQLPKIPTPRLIRHKSKTGIKAGLPPGTLVHIGPRRTEKKTIELIQYNASEINEAQSDDVSEILDMVDK
ncbi:MAG: hypothetical protein P8X57_12285, partial [Cyclobacteriaceae bacterium]